VGPMSGELDGGAQEGGGKRVGREYQYVLTAHVVSLHAGSKVGCRDCPGGASKRETIHAPASGTTGP
jgi:hypothetical protein